MSHIIFFSPPAHGHVNPVLPVIQELVERGERVMVYNAEEFRASAERAGAAFRPYPATDLTSTAINEVLADGNISRMSTLLLRTTEALLPFVVEELKRDQPDLAVFDATAMWAKGAADITNTRGAATIPHFVLEGAPEARQLPPLGQFIFGWLPQVPRIMACVSRLQKRYGRVGFKPTPPLFPVRGGLNIVFTAQDLNPASTLIDDTFRFVGPSINPQTRAGAFPFETLGPGPLVYISLGTIHSTNTAFYRTCFEAFGTEPGHFILSAGKETDIQSLGPIPPNFTVRPTVPQLEVLQRTEVFVTHGGMNSIHEGLYYGVPLILAPQQLEQYFASKSVAARGAGVTLEGQVMRRNIAAADLRQALRRVRAEPQYRHSAQTLQAALRATGGYRQAADEIQAHIRATNPVS